jgi:carboxypeptidase T
MTYLRITAIILLASVYFGAQAQVCEHQQTITPVHESIIKADGSFSYGLWHPAYSVKMNFRLNGVILTPNVDYVIDSENEKGILLNPGLLELAKTEELKIEAVRIDDGPVYIRSARGAFLGNFKPKCCRATKSGTPVYSRVKVFADYEGLRKLAEHGVAVDHGTHKKNTFYISDFSDREIQTMHDLGFDTEILIEDVTAYYQAQNEAGSPRSGNERGGNPCPGSGSSATVYPTPTNWSLGSMGGYLTYQQYLDNIDAMVAQYPNLITVKQQIGSITTHNNNPIYWLRISDNPNTDEAEPEVLYTAIHHAREPASLSQLVYYMWYLLENYSSNAEVQYLVDNVEMYFVPVVNPDGYLYNEQIQPNGGGMWRKNRRNNGGGEWGVDLNRNYSYQFGFSGVSTDPAAENYLGPSAFSEPETQAMKLFCESRDFKIATNAHTFGDLLLHPFGYDVVQTAEHTLFQRWSKSMVRENGFSNILSADLYPAAGDSDDWMYGDVSTKPKIYAMTPEIGPDAEGFWPPSNRITDICNGLVWQNLAESHLAYKYVEVIDRNSTVIESLVGYLKFDVEALGLVPANYTVTITPHGFGLNSVGSPVAFNGMNHMDLETDSISYTLDPAITAGQTFQYILSIDNGEYTFNDTISKLYGQPSVAFVDNGNSLTNWSSNDWNTTTNEFYSPSTSITDSPFGNYNDNDVTNITLNNPVDLSNAVAATLSFWGQWDIEIGWDYAQVMGSSDGGNTWSPLCGKYTVIGNGNQDTGNPLYDGTQLTWVDEEIDLNDYLGGPLLIRFRMVSDQAVNEDGFYFDDLQVNIISGTGVGIQEDMESLFELSQNMPNPAGSYTFINYKLPVGVSSGTLKITNAIGQVIQSISLDGMDRSVQVNTNNMSQGLYHYQIVTKDLKSAVKRMAVVK